MIVNLMGLSTTNYCNLFIVRNIFIIYVTHSHISLFNKPCDENLIKVLTLRKFPNVELSDVPLVTRTPSLYLPTPSHSPTLPIYTPSLYPPTLSSACPHDSLRSLVIVTQRVPPLIQI